VYTLYTDDLVILASSWLAQQKLLNVCNECVVSLDMIFDISRSATMIFAPYKIAKLYTFPSLTLIMDVHWKL